MISVAHLGSRPLSRQCLQLMHEHPDIDVTAVVTYSDDYDGWWQESLHDLATSLGYPIVNENELFEYDLDYLISTLYYNILDEELLSHPTYGGLNLHQAELPRYRGSNTFSHAILNARKDDYWKYGTTLHFMSKQVDSGDIIARRFVEITETDTAKSLYEKTEEASVELFKEMLPKIVSGAIQEMRIPQSEFNTKQYFYPKTSLNDKKYIPSEELGDPQQEQNVYDKIRAVHFPPFEPAYTKNDGKKIYLTLDYNYE